MIQGWLIGDKELVAKLSAAPGKIAQSLSRAMTSLLLELEGKVQRDKLSGQALKVKTGTLRRSITHKIDIQPDAITGIVGTNVPYAAKHEYGFQGAEQVKAHFRTIKKAWGHEIKGGAKQISVSAHSRQVSFPERSFLRSALAEMSDRIKENLAKAAGEVMKA